MPGRKKADAALRLCQLENENVAAEFVCVLAWNVIAVLLFIWGSFRPEKANSKNRTERKKYGRNVVTSPRCQTIQFQFQIPDLPKQVGVMVHKHPRAIYHSAMKSGETIQFALA